MDGPLVQVVLPLVLGFMMLTMGLGLTAADFKRVVTQPKAFFTGAINQIVLLPIVTFAIATLAGFEPVLAAGFMILAACPGGVTSNVLAHYAKADVALSITLTSVASLLGFVTIPLIISFSLSHFMGEAQTVPPPTKLIAGSVFVLTIVPVSLGMLVNHLQPDGARAAEPWMNRISAVLFVIIVIAAVAVNWTLFVTNLASMGLAVFALLVVMLGIGYGSAVALGLPSRQSTTIALETGIQNSTMGLFIGTTLLGNEALALPAAIYGVLMYGPASLLLFALRGRNVAEAAA